MKNAKENVKCCIEDLEYSKEHLTKALSTVEKDVNRKNIENSLQAVEKALSCTKSTMDNYYEPSKK